MGIGILLFMVYILVGLQDYRFTLSRQKGVTNLVAEDLSFANIQAVQFLPEPSSL